MQTAVSDNKSEPIKIITKLNTWKRKTGGLTTEEYSDFSNTLTRNKELHSTTDEFTSDD